MNRKNKKKKRKDVESKNAHTISLIKNKKKSEGRKIIERKK